MGGIFSKGGGNTFLNTRSSSPKGGSFSTYLGEKIFPGGLRSSIFGGASSSDEEEESD
jgi:hypothetical protein